MSLFFKIPKQSQRSRFLFENSFYRRWQNFFHINIGGIFVFDKKMYSKWHLLLFRVFCCQNKKCAHCKCKNGVLSCRIHFICLTWARASSVEIEWRSGLSLRLETKTAIAYKKMWIGKKCSKTTGKSTLHWIHFSTNEKGIWKIAVDEEFSVQPVCCWRCLVLCAFFLLLYEWTTQKNQSNTNQWKTIKIKLNYIPN